MRSCQVTAVPGQGRRRGAPGRCRHEGPRGTRRGGRAARLRARRRPGPGPGHRSVCPPSPGGGPSPRGTTARTGTAAGTGQGSDLPRDRVLVSPAGTVLVSPGGRTRAPRPVGGRLRRTVGRVGEGPVMCARPPSRPGPESLRTGGPAGPWTTRIRPRAAAAPSALRRSGERPRRRAPCRVSCRGAGAPAVSVGARSVILRTVPCPPLAPLPSAPNTPVPREFPCPRRRHRPAGRRPVRGAGRAPAEQPATVLDGDVADPVT
ncbi:hypothetical protein EDD98_3819 [Streptomyces sp. PanSC19]|nr:hypothetical protein EDD98_3819 [Streptomyces sp. PanSC19]